MAHGGDIYSHKIDLDFSVSLNPFPPSQDLEAAVLSGLKRAGCYPDIRQTRLRTLLAEKNNVEADNVLAGNGASEMLLSAVRSISPRNVLLPVPCFTGYRHILDASGCCRTEPFFLKEEDGFAIPPAFPEVIQESHDLLILTDPGNPAGRNIDEKILYDILDRCRETKTKVILDESFYFLSRKACIEREKSAAALIRRYPGLYIIRSWTKLFSLPGIRMGYVISSHENIWEVQAHIPEWNLPVITEEVMAELAGRLDEGMLRTMCLAVREERDFFVPELAKRTEKVYPSDSVYILFRAEEGLYEKLLARGILIRDCGDYEGLGKGYYRTAVKTRQENLCLLKKLDEVREWNCSR